MRCSADDENVVDPKRFLPTAAGEPFRRDSSALVRGPLDRVNRLNQQPVAQRLIGLAYRSLKPAISLASAVISLADNPVGENAIIYLADCKVGEPLSTELAEQEEAIKA